MTNSKTIMLVVLLAMMLIFGGEIVEQDEIPRGNINEIMQDQKAQLTVTPTPTKAPEYTFKKLDLTMYATTNVNVRSLPSTTGDKLATLSKGEEIQVTGECNEVSWYRVIYENKTAYIHADYLSKEKPVTPTPTPTPIAKYANSFVVAEENAVYVLDTYGPKVVKDVNGVYTDIPLAKSVQPMDMVYRNGEFYVYDEIKEELQVYREDGTFLFALPLLLEERDAVRWFEEKQEEVALITYAGNRYVFDRENEVILAPEKVLEAKPEEGYDYAEIVGYDREGNVYTANTVLVKNSSIIAGEIALYVRTPDGTLLGVAVLPMEKYEYLPDHYIRIAEDGRIYTMLGVENAFRVEELFLTEHPVSNLAQITEKTKTLEKKYIKNSKNRLQSGYTNLGDITLSRQEIYERAVYMADYEWTLAKKNVRVSRFKSAILPRYITAIVNEQDSSTAWKVKMTGIPYCWGGFISPYRNKRNQFDTLIYEDGYLAGNINYDEYYIGETAGVDCSGYVAAAYGISTKPSTGMLSDIGTRLYDIHDLQQMDMIVAPGDHVILFCEKISDGTFFAAEASLRAGKVVVHPRSLNALVTEGTYQMNSPW